YQWQCNGTNIPGATASVLNLHAPVSSQSGSYSVLISNAAGTVRSSTTSVLIWPPLSLSRFGTDAVVSWEGSFTLQSSTNAQGLFLDIPAASSPYTNEPSTVPTRFFRLKLAPSPLGLSVLAQSNLVLQWTGPFTLQSATNIMGPFLDVPGATR